MMRRCILISSTELPELFPLSATLLFSRTCEIFTHARFKWKAVEKNENTVSLTVDSDIKAEIVFGIIYEACEKLTEILQARHPGELLKIEPVNWHIDNFDFAIYFKSWDMIKAAQKYLYRRNKLLFFDTTDDTLKKYLHTYFEEHPEYAKEIRTFIAEQLQKRIVESDAEH